MAVASPSTYCQVRSLTEALAAPLSAEDQTAQSMADVSPTKWHRAHTTWFFEEFVLGPHAPGYQPFHDGYRYLFNSYYEAVGERHPRAERGVVTRPGIAEIAEYRRHVDEAMTDLLDGGVAAPVAALVELGLHHEQQHQELAVMDIKHVLSRNRLDPAYRNAVGDIGPSTTRPLGWVEHAGGLVEIGHDGDGFAFDNEGPRHQVHLAPFALADRALTDGEVAAFVADGGYRRPELWLSDGWARVQAERWEAPLYWQAEDDGSWSQFTLAGRHPLDPAAPACHLSYYEADAIARWAGARLPTEAEWEAVAGTRPMDGRFLDLDVLAPQPANPTVAGPQQLFGDVWEWTSSAYLPYPGFRTAPGAVGEYNGKFMVNQHVLRGGCCATPPGHVRTTYRNFFPPHARWAFSGARLARDLHLDAAAWQRSLVDAARTTLAARPPHVAPVWFYDERGSDLFDQITRLPEYYPTRTERALLADHADDLAALDVHTVVELGSGTSDKTTIILEALLGAGSLERYVPFDVSEETLRAAAADLDGRYPDLEVHGIVGDFHRLRRGERSEATGGSGDCHRVGAHRAVDMADVWPVDAGGAVAEIPLILDVGACAEYGLHADHPQRAHRSVGLHFQAERRFDEVLAVGVAGSGLEHRRIVAYAQCHRVEILHAERFHGDADDATRGQVAAADAQCQRWLTGRGPLCH